MADDTQKVLIRGIEPRLKGKIARRVRDTGTSMNDVLAQILADHYELLYTPTGGSAREVGPSPEIMLYLPPDLLDAIDLDAQASNATRRDTVVRIISGHFRVAFRSTARWPARSRKAA